MTDKIKYKIIDNFLSYAEFTELKNNILPIFSDHSTEGRISWSYINRQVGAAQPEPNHLKDVTNIEVVDPEHDWYFTHMIWSGIYQSQQSRSILPLLNKIYPLSVYRINVNFTVQQPERLGRSVFHKDYFGDAPVKSAMTTSIFYMNTTNGPTILEDGTEIECRANRLVSYSAETYHAGVLCTDQPHRIVINLNYFLNGEI